MTTEQKLDDIIARLERIEQRQIKTTDMVKEVSGEVQPRGSFATGYQHPKD
jgi:uncharacterized protein (UPF0335 family)